MLSAKLLFFSDGVDVRVGIYNPTVPEDEALGWLRETPILWEGTFFHSNYFSF